MSDQAWAIQAMQKYKLKVCFYDKEIESPCGKTVTFGTLYAEYQTFYGALTYMIGRLSN